jgi:hypothetical protein
MYRRGGGERQGGWIRGESIVDMGGGEASNKNRANGGVGWARGGGGGSGEWGGQRPRTSARDRAGHE